MLESVNWFSSRRFDGCFSLRASGHPAIAGVDITCSDDPPRIGSHFKVAVPLDSARYFVLDSSDECVKVMNSTQL